MLVWVCVHVALNKVFVSLCACVQRVCVRGCVFASEFCVLKKKMTERACILCVQDFNARAHIFLNKKREGRFLF